MTGNMVVRRSASQFTTRSVVPHFRGFAALRCSARRHGICAIQHKSGTAMAFRESLAPCEFAVVFWQQVVALQTIDGTTLTSGQAVIHDRFFNSRWQERKPYFVTCKLERKFCGTDGSTGRTESSNEWQPWLRALDERMCPPQQRSVSLCVSRRIDIQPSTPWARSVRNSVRNVSIC